MNLFKKPHPFIFNANSVVIPGAVAFLVIVMLAPLGFGEVEFIQRLKFGGIFGTLASVVVAVTVPVLKKLFPNYMKEDDWTVGKEIIQIMFVILLICFANYAIAIMLGFSQSGAWETFKSVVIFTVVISLFPVFVLVLIEQYTLQKKKLQQAELLNAAMLREKIGFADSKQTGSSISIEAENGAVELNLIPNAIQFIQSDGNYTEIFYLDEDSQQQKKLIRNRLKYFLDILPKTEFLQCHKSYIVNIEHVESVTGNARNFELILKGMNTHIPVSRSKTQEFRGRFS